MAGGFGDSCQYVVIGVAKNQWAVAADVIDVIIAIDIRHDGAFARFNRDGVAADGFERANGRTDTAWHDFTGPLMGFL